MCQPENVNEWIKTIDKAYNKIRSQIRINPSKKQMRTHFENNFKEDEVNQIFRRYLIKKSTRSESGVLVVTVTLSPHKFSCKFDCSYCPQETDLEGNHTQPRSYMSSEPAMRRALRHNFDIRGQFCDETHMGLRCEVPTSHFARFG